MYLKALEIAGFKSFARKSELEFSAPIVAIVGPNGSGKSNVAEAFRFVLGEQSIKSMRGKRGEDLIFSGGKGAGNLNRAGVRLTFDNSKRVFNLDFPEVTVERVVYRDGTNEYLLNGTKVRLKDVYELLAGANIGASGHHIISQGEADRILNASIKERKEMIEDALGLKIYQYKKEESERKLDKTTENISQVTALRKEIAPHIKFLEKQVEKIQKAETLKTELVELFREYLRREEIYLKDAKDALEKERKDPKAEKEKLEKRLGEVKKILAESESADGESRELLSVERGLREAEEALEKVLREGSRIEGTIAAEERALERAKKEASGASRLSIELSELEELKEKADALRAKADTQSDVGALRTLFSEFVNLLSHFIASKKSAGGSSGSVASIEKELEALREKKEKLFKEEKEKASEKAAKQKKYESVRTSIEEGRTKGREAEREMFSLMNRRTELMMTLSNLSLREETLRRDEDAFKAELEEAAALAGPSAIRYSDVTFKDAESREEQEARKKKLERMKIRLEEAGGAGGEEVLKEYKEVQERDSFLSREITDLEVSAESLKGLIADLSERLDQEFKVGIEKINKEFGKFFSLMFGGGNASLSVSEREVRKRKANLLEDMENEEMVEEPETEEGIDIAVSLPNKRVKGLQMLSGGERALTSIALLFAISQVNPPPFVILDETDAALDEANSKKYGDMIESLSKYSQLILITHNRETMGRAGILYGVTMGGDGVSKLLSVKFEEAVAVAK